MPSNPVQRVSVISAVLAAFVIATGSRLSRAQSPSAADPPVPTFGFEPLEIFKLDERSANLIAADLNADGLTDLLLADNSHSRLDLLLQRRERAEPSPTPAGRAPVNVVPDSQLFEHRKLPVDQEVVAAAVGDFDADGRKDIAYFGAPDRLVVRFQPEAGEWTRRREYRLAEVAPRPWCVAAGDMNGDGRDDLAVLGTKALYLLMQEPDGLPSAPQRLMNTSDDLGSVRTAEVNGDGRNDLVYFARGDQERSLCVRFQDPTGRLGPELRLEFSQPRGVFLHNLDGKPGDELLSVDARTGRVQVQRLGMPAADDRDELTTQLIQYGFGGAGRNRDLATADVDGDGLADVVVTEPEAARVLVFRQRRGLGLDLGTPFPSLSGAEQVRAADLDGKPGEEVVILSSKERAIGVSQFRDGRVTFPQPLPAAAEPVAIAAADLDGDARKEIVYISRQRTGASSTYALHALRRNADGSWQPHRFGEQASRALELTAAPQRMLTLDADGNGRDDLLVFLELDRPPLLLLATAEGVLEAVSAEGGVGLGTISAGALFALGGKERGVLVARDNFARRLQLDREPKWQVLDQYNAADANARVAGAAALDLDGQPGEEIVLVDTGARKLRVLRSDGTLYRPWQELELGTFPYLSTHAADLNGDGRSDLLLFGEGKFAVLYAGRRDPALESIASFETNLEQANFTDLAAGDLNGDGIPDIAAIDTRSHRIELLSFDPQEGLRPALAFKVFEEKSFSASRGTGSEPREAVIADVTGDNLADLVLLAHDRVLVYPQEAAPEGSR